MGNLSGRYRFPSGDLSLRAMVEAGSRGSREGADLAGEARLDGGGVTLGSRVSLYGFADPTRPDRDAISFGYVLSAGFAPAGIARFRLEWEHDTNRLVGQRYRVVALVSLAMLENQPRRPQRDHAERDRDRVRRNHGDRRSGARRRTARGHRADARRRGGAARVAASRQRGEPLPQRRDPFPPETITIRFNHRRHVKDLDFAAASATTAHGRATPLRIGCCRSPRRRVTHINNIDHADLGDVRAGKEASGQCGYCHLGADAGKGGRVARMVMSTANLRFST